MIVTIKHIHNTEKFKATIWTRLHVGEKEEGTDSKLFWVMSTAISNRDSCSWRSWLGMLMETYLDKLKLVKENFNLRISCSGTSAMATQSAKQAIRKFLGAVMSVWASVWVCICGCVIPVWQSSFLCCRQKTYSLLLQKPFCGPLLLHNTRVRRFIESTV